MLCCREYNAACEEHCASKQARNNAKVQTLTRQLNAAKTSQDIDNLCRECKVQEHEDCFTAICCDCGQRFCCANEVDMRGGLKGHWLLRHGTAAEQEKARVAQAAADDRLVEKRW